MTEKRTQSYLRKEFLATAVLQMKAQAQWEVACYSDRARDLHKTLVL